jgi:hypothetical protein
MLIRRFAVRTGAYGEGSIAAMRLGSVNTGPVLTNHLVTVTLSLKANLPLLFSIEAVKLEPAPPDPTPTPIPTPPHPIW